MSQQARLAADCVLVQRRLNAVRAMTLEDWRQFNLSAARHIKDEVYRRSLVAMFTRASDYTLIQTKMDYVRELQEEATSCQTQP